MQVQEETVAAEWLLGIGQHGAPMSVLIQQSLGRTLGERCMICGVNTKQTSHWLLEIRISTGLELAGTSTLQYITFHMLHNPLVATSVTSHGKLLT